MQHDKNIKKTRSELKEWGRYLREGGEPHSQSIMAIFIDQQKSKPIASGKSDVATADAIETRRVRRTTELSYTYENFPRHVSDLDDFINKQRPECVRALMQRYVKQIGKSSMGRTEQFWLIKAEQAVMAR